MAAELLPQEAVQAWIDGRSGWRLRDGAIRKKYLFPSFRSAIVFVNRVATVADELNHHPDIDIRYDKIFLALSTHDAGGITQKDLDLATRVDFGDLRALTASFRLTLAFGGAAGSPATGLRRAYRFNQHLKPPV